MSRQEPLKESGRSWQARGCVFLHSALSEIYHKARPTLGLKNSFRMSFQTPSGYFHICTLHPLPSVRINASLRETHFSLPAPTSPGKLGSWEKGQTVPYAGTHPPAGQRPSIQVWGWLLSPPLQVMGVYSVPESGYPFPGEQVLLLSWGEGRLDDGLLGILIGWSMVNLCPGEYSP